MLESTRVKIDKLDKEIVKLLVQRMEISEEISRIKYEKKIKILDSNRENIVLNNVIKNSEEYSKEIVEIYKEIIKQSKNVQN